LTAQAKRALPEKPIHWDINYSPSSEPASDDPDCFYEQPDMGTDVAEELDEHARFLIGDWPR